MRARIEWTCVGAACLVAGCLTPLPTDVAHGSSIALLQSLPRAGFSRPADLAPLKAWADSVTPLPHRRPTIEEPSPDLLRLGTLPDGEMHTLDWHFGGSDRRTAIAVVGHVRPPSPEDGIHEADLHAAKLGLIPGAFAGVLRRAPPPPGEMLEPTIDAAPHLLWGALPEWEPVRATDRPGLYIASNGARVTRLIRTFDDAPLPPEERWPRRLASGEPPPFEPVLSVAATFESRPFVVAAMQRAYHTRFAEPPTGEDADTLRILGERALYETCRSRFDCDLPEFHDPIDARQEASYEAVRQEERSRAEAEEAARREEEEWAKRAAADAAEAEKRREAEAASAAERAAAERQRRIADARALFEAELAALDEEAAAALPVRFRRVESLSRAAGALLDAGDGPSPAERAAAARFVGALRHDLTTLATHERKRGRLATAAYLGRALQLLHGQGATPRPLSALLAGPALPGDAFVIPALRLLPKLRPLWTGDGLGRLLARAANVDGTLNLPRLGLTATPDEFEKLWDTRGADVRDLTLEESDALTDKVTPVEVETRTTSKVTEVANPAWAEWDARADHLLGVAERARASYLSWTSGQAAGEHVETTTSQQTVGVRDGGRVQWHSAIVTESKVVNYVAQAASSENERLYKEFQDAADAYNDHLLTQPPRVADRTDVTRFVVRGERQQWFGHLAWHLTSRQDPSLDLTNTAAGALPQTRVAADFAHGVEARGSFYTHAAVVELARERLRALQVPALIERAQKASQEAVEAHIERVGAAWSPEERDEEFLVWHVILFDQQEWDSPLDRRDLSTFPTALLSPEPR